MPARSGSNSLEYLAKSARGEFLPDTAKCGWSKGLNIQEANLGKHLEASAYALAQCPDAHLQKQLDDAVTIVQNGQRADGWLYGFGIVGHLSPWGCMCMQYEGCMVGHYYEAAAALYETTGRDAFLQAAAKPADHTWNTFLGPNAREGFPGHAGIELALRLYRLTGKQIISIWPGTSTIDREESAMHFRQRSSLSDSRAARQSALRPVPLRNIAIQDSFWSPKLETYRTNSIEAGWSNNTIKTALDLLDRSARGDISSTPVKCGWSRGCINEANLGKHLEAVAYCLAQWPDAQMQTRYEEAIATVQKGSVPTGGCMRSGLSVN